MILTCFLLLNLLILIVCDEIVIKPHSKKCFSFLLVCCSFKLTTSITFVFTVKDAEETRELIVGKKKYICSFKYQCTGGTDEQWDISIHEANGGVECVVQRYLKASSFSIESLIIFIR
jgi:hypothetical protein